MMMTPAQFHSPTLSAEARRVTFDWTQGALGEGLHHYNIGEFFAAHESWESVWITAQKPEKTFLQGLIQVTVALHHFHRNNLLGTTRLLQAALGKLEAYPPDFGGIDIALLRNDIRDRLHSLESDPPAEHLIPARISPL